MFTYVPEILLFISFVFFVFGLFIWSTIAAASVDTGIRLNSTTVINLGIGAAFMAPFITLLLRGGLL